ncbi:DUF2461 domain-containing protein [Phaeodactylibacter luteus]|uniref:DUF2461 domain-containing protein n=1 Tax=Phaeodactylibacter luteus TaxID=1564516 RepID=A0A5C6S2P0_9BACT|nr:DUF2461 domain-containing protein [Phaeodactylibacter luteus]TXB68889.1 DUF2461 domain-containing protein [Phaeodactylibacter luteus]
MDFKALYQFLEDLRDNNHKAWLDEHRPRYKALREDFIAYVSQLNDEIAARVPGYLPKPARESISRINNNLVFKPDAPTYKDHFSAGLGSVDAAASMYLHIGLGENMIAGGFYKPPSNLLKRIRAAIDYDGEVLQRIIDDKEFLEVFGGLYSTGALKTAPKGYASDHPHIHLLREKSFAVTRTFSREAVCGTSFTKEVIRSVVAIQPFLQYLNRAVSVEA